MRLSIFLFSFFLFSSAFSIQLTERPHLDTLSVKSLNENFKQFINIEPLYAYTFAQNALDLAREEKDALGEAAALNNIGVFYKQRGDLKKALEYYQQALRIQDSLTNEDGKALCLSNIGTIYSIIGDYDKAFSNYSQALQIFEQNNDYSRMVGLISNMGNIFREQGNTQEAINRYLLAIEIFESSDEKIDYEIFPFSGLGNVYFENNNFDEALKYYQLAFDYSLDKNDKSQQASSLFDLANTYLALNKTQKALDLALEGLELAFNSNLKPTEMYLYKLLSEIYFKKGQIKQAYDNLIKHYEIKNIINSEENQKALRDIEMVYELESSQREIELLKKEGELRDLYIRNSKLVTLTIVIVSILLFALVVVIYLKYQENRKANIKLAYQNKEIARSKDILEAQKRLIEDKNQNMTDSILYAKSLQDSILRSSDISNSFPNHFVFFKPKDIVSGDFYWHHRKDEIEILAVGDCTGHGVAGAFMTVIANTLLNQVVIEDGNTDPAEILSILDNKVNETLKQDQKSNTTTHGMDLAILKISTKEKSITFAGAKRPLLYYDMNGNQVFIKGNVYSIGEIYGERISKKFTEKTIAIDEIKNLYLFTDGFADQFGYEINKKYMTKRFRELISQIQNQSLQQQSNSLAMEIKRWMGSTIQTDDMLVLGIKIN